MLENLFKLSYMVSKSSRDMAQRGLNSNVITLIAKTIMD